MFRLVYLDEENTEQRALYKYISSAVSKTIIDCSMSTLITKSVTRPFTLRIFWVDSFQA